MFKNKLQLIKFCCYRGNIYFEKKQSYLSDIINVYVNKYMKQVDKGIFTFFMFRHTVFLYKVFRIFSEINR